MSEDKFLFDEIIASVEFHFISGAKLEFLVSGWNITMASFCDMTVTSELSSDEKISMLENLRKISDAYSVIIVSVWFSLEAKRSGEILRQKEAMFINERVEYSKVILIQELLS